MEQGGGGMVGGIGGDGGCAERITSSFGSWAYQVTGTLGRLLTHIRIQQHFHPPMSQRSHPSSQGIRE